MKRQIGLVRGDGSDTPALAFMGKRHRQAMLFGSPVDGLAEYGVKSVFILMWLMHRPVL
jgi:hypothetical protein